LANTLLNKTAPLFKFKMSSTLQPLQSTLDSILSRLSFLEAQAGVKSQSPPAVSTTIHNGNGPSKTDDSHAAIPPSLIAYDEHIESSLQPFIKACNDIEPLKPIGSNIHKVWTGIRTIILIGTKCKKPTNVQESLMPHLKPVQDAMAEIRTTRLDRKYDWHVKAIMEMLVCASWVIMTPPTTPTSFVKDTVGSSDFWSNKIRKEYKGNDEKHVVFCDTMKKLILDLSGYVKEYHLSGLMWNNVNGIALEEYSGPDLVLKKKVSSTAVNPPLAAPAGASTDIMKELASKRTSDGSSAATGLKKVSRDQQTWCKEYKATKPLPSNSSTSVVPTATTVKPSEIKANQKKDAKAPVCKFQSIGSKWIVENQTKTSNPNGVCVVEVQNPKEQVYM
jgi:adenylyl cyclase-associated protein